MEAQIWFTEEADRWYERNREALVPHRDLLIQLLEFCNLYPKRVLEVGAANGWRLAVIHKKFGSEVWAVEPSQKAILDGKKRFPFVNFIRGLGEDINFEEFFDLIIVHYVFHWVERGHLLRFMERLDRALREEGFLLVGDFGSPGFLKRPYHHRPGLYTWKMDYGSFWAASGRYLEIVRLRYNYETKKVDPALKPYESGMLWLLKKIDCHLEEK